MTRMLPGREAIGSVRRTLGETFRAGMPEADTRRMNAWLEAVVHDAGAVLLGAPGASRPVLTARRALPEQGPESLAAAGAAQASDSPKNAAGKVYFCRFDAGNSSRVARRPTQRDPILALTILGLSGALTHDPSAALYIDGKLVAAAEEERFVRDKHTKNRMPRGSEVLPPEFAGLKPGDVDAVAIPFSPISLAEKARAGITRERYWYAPDRSARRDPDRQPPLLPLQSASSGVSSNSAST